MSEKNGKLKTKTLPRSGKPLKRCYYLLIYVISLRFSVMSLQSFFSFFSYFFSGSATSQDGETKSATADRCHHLLGAIRRIHGQGV